MSELHLTERDLAGYLSRELGPDERRRVEAHLSRCSRCCDEFVALGPLVGGRRGSRRSWIAAGLAAAAGLAGMLLLGPQLFVDAGAPVLRSTDEAAAILDLAVEPVLPAIGEAVDRGELRFVWRSVQPGAQYAVTVTDAAGTEILRRPTSDTFLVVEPEIELVRGEPYLWEVSALLNTGETARASFRRFEVR